MSNLTFHATSHAQLTELMSTVPPHSTIVLAPGTIIESQITMAPYITLSGSESHATTQIVNLSHIEKIYELVQRVARTLPTQRWGGMVEDENTDRIILDELTDIIESKLIYLGLQGVDSKEMAFNIFTSGAALYENWGLSEVDIAILFNVVQNSIPSDRMYTYAEADRLYGTLSKPVKKSEWKLVKKFTLQPGERLTIKPWDTEFFEKVNFVYLKGGKIIHRSDCSGNRLVKVETKYDFSDEVRVITKSSDYIRVAFNREIV